MKKIVLSLASVMAAVAFAPEASALPVFARQTGMACSACHFQHFPLLNGFGRAFKAAGYTMMGAQGKVETAEGEHGSTLSIPNTLNLGVLTTTRYDQVSAGATAAPATGGHWGVPGSGGELSIFFGGRISEFAGFLSELGLTAGAAGVGAAKLAMLFPVADARVGLVAITTGGQGIAHSFELLNTGAANTHKVSAFNGAGNGGRNHVAVTSAAQQLGTNTAATGVSLVANNSMGFVVLGKYEQAGAAATAGLNAAGTAHNLPLTYLRLAGTFDVMGFDSAVGIQNWSGTSALIMPGVTNRATVIDAQAQGEISGLPVGFYASYGTAPAGSQFSGSTAAVAAVPAFGAVAAVAAAPLTVTTTAASTFNFTAEVGVIPHVATVQLALRSAKDGQVLATTTNVNNAIMVGGTYELAQNVELSLTSTSNSGSAWNVGGTRAGMTGKTETTLMLEALF